MMNSIDRYSVYDLIFSLEREMDRLKNREHLEHDDKTLKELENQLTFLWDFVLTRE